MGGCLIYNIVNSAERITFSQFVKCIRPNGLKIRPWHTVDVESMRVDDDAAVFYLFRNALVSVFRPHGNQLTYVAFPDLSGGPSSVKSRI